MIRDSHIAEIFLILSKTMRRRIHNISYDQNFGSPILRFTRIFNMKEFSENVLEVGGKMDTGLPPTIINNITEHKVSLMNDNIVIDYGVMVNNPNDFLDSLKKEVWYIYSHSFNEDVEEVLTEDKKQV